MFQEIAGSLSNRSKIQSRITSCSVYCINSCTYCAIDLPKAEVRAFDNSEASVITQG